MFNIFKRNKTNVEEVIKTSDTIVFQVLDDTTDEVLTKLATHIINSEPVIANLINLDIESANKAIAFLSGVVYAIDGEIVLIKEKIFMFADKEVYEDGSVKELLESL